MLVVSVVPLALLSSSLTAGSTLAAVESDVVDVEVDADDDSISFLFSL